MTSVFRCRIAISACAGFGLAGVAAAQPANDDCASATPLAGDSLTVSFNNGCVCELDGDDVQVNVFDLLAYLDLWFALAPGADIDGTPGVDVFDLLFFLDCWFPASAGAPCPTASTDGAGDTLCDAFGTNQIENDLWYCWTPTSSGEATVATCGLTGLDTKLAAYDGCGCPTGPAIACNGDDCALQSRITFPVVGGQTYLVRLGTFSGTAFGAGELSLDAAPAPTGACCISGFAGWLCAEDMTEADCLASTLGIYYGDGSTCADATPGTPCGPPANTGDECEVAIPIGDGVVMGTTSDNTGSTGDDTSCAFSDNIDEWYAYTAPCTGVAAISLCGSNFDTTLAVFDACRGTELACNDDACGLQSEVNFAATAGQTYLIRVSGFTDSIGAFTLEAACGPG